MNNIKERIKNIIKNNILINLNNITISVEMHRTKNL